MGNGTADPIYSLTLSGTDLALSNWTNVFPLTTNTIGLGYAGYRYTNLFLTGGVAFYGHALQATAPVVTGSRGGNAALASLLTGLANTGLIVDSSTA